jgi:hypothetical protein
MGFHSSSSFNQNSILIFWCADSAMSSVFVYGTLMSEEVVDVLIKRQPRRLPGGFKARMIYIKSPQRESKAS